MTEEAILELINSAQAVGITWAMAYAVRGLFDAFKG